MKVFWASCPRCDFAQLERVPRSFWMRLLPRWRHYHCADCSANVLAPKKRVDAGRWAAGPKTIPIAPASPQRPQ